MTDDMKDSIKAKLWDLKFNPFMSTYILSWIYINLNFILILFTSDLKINSKLIKLNDFPINNTDSVWIALAYVLLYPFAKTAFFAVGLWFKGLTNEVEILMRKETPLPQAKIIEILDENVKLQNDYQDSLIKLETIKDEYKTKSTTIEDEFKEKSKVQNEYIIKEQKKIDDTIKDSVTKETIYLNDKINILEKNIITLKSNEKDLEHKLGMEKGKNSNIKNTKKPKNLAEQIINKNLKIDLSDDEIKLLKIIYENDISSKSKSDYMSSLLSAKQFKRIKIQSLLDSLVKKGIISIADGQYNFHDITTEGSTIILALFDEKHNKSSYNKPIAI